MGKMTESWASRSNFIHSTSAWISDTFGGFTNDFNTKNYPLQKEKKIAKK